MEDPVFGVERQISQEATPYRVVSPLMGEVPPYRYRLNLLRRSQVTTSPILVNSPRNNPLIHAASPQHQQPMSEVPFSHSSVLSASREPPEYDEYSYTY